MAAGCESLADLQHWIDLEVRKYKGIGEASSIHTRNFPKRAGELLDGGSVFNIMRSVIQCRRRVLDIRELKGDDGRPVCQILLEPQLMRVEPLAHKPFQGWRYLEPAKAPKDIGLLRRGANDDEMPAEMAEELRKLGLL